MIEWKMFDTKNEREYARERERKRDKHRDTDK